MQPEGLNLGQENSAGNRSRWEGGFVSFLSPWIFLKEWWSKQKNLLLLGFDATLSREEGQKLTKIMRPRHWPWSGISGFEDGEGRDQRVQVVSRSWKRQINNEFSPTASRMELNSDDSLILVQWDPFQTPDFQNCKIRHLHCFKLLTSVSICYSRKRKLTQGVCTPDLVIMGLSLKTLETNIN